MKKIFIFFFLPLLGISLSVFAKKVEITDARLIAKNVYFEQVNRHDAIGYQTIAITSEYVEKYNDRDVYYAFNFNNKGFVLISADDICYPVIGFSFESTYSPTEQASEFAYWMNERKTEIAYNLDHNLTTDAIGIAAWQRLNTTDPSQLLSNDKSIMDVAPLVTSLWDQGYPYNDLVPMDAGCGSFNGHVTTGCVATAMAQLMYYWRWPNTGTGTHCDIHNNYGQLCADFGSTNYDFNGMVNQPSKECLPVSTLIYHAGIAVNMNYNLDGLCSSGAYTSDVAGALRNYFKYANTTTYVQKSGYSTASWNSLLQGDLDAGKPMNYSGQGSSGGHSWVCDGYQATDYYHFNWGWSGSNNGYFYLTNLNPGGYNFNSQQQAVVHITPDPALYPSYCTGASTINTDDFGTFDDGSGPAADYQDNSNCSWLIAPDDSIKTVKLGFIRFNTDPADVLTVYDGPTTASPVLGTYSGSTLPTATPTSTGPQMLVTFVSNSSTTAPGFLLSYDATPIAFCNSSTTLTDPIGSFSDNSGRFQYRNGTICRWILNPTNAVSITVHFSDFNTEPTNDKVQIYNLGVNPQVVLATYSGDYTAVPPDDVVIPSGHGMVMWQTSKSIRGAGWNANYDIVLGTDNQKAFEDLSVFPNPSDGMLNIHFTMNETQSVRIDIISLKGETVYNQTLGSFKGNFDKQVDLSSLAKGIYVLRLTSDQGTTNAKIVLK